jgi:hypothetical protein
MTITTIRRWHSYVGLFIAPSVVLFALTGALQLFNLHEAHGNYKPAALLEKLSSVHKDQVFTRGQHPAPPSPEAAAALRAEADDEEDKPSVSTVILKGFFLIVALCLALSTSIGVWMGLTQTRPRKIAWLLLAAGTLIPLGLLVSA